MGDAPVWALQSIIAILLLKLDRRRIPRSLDRAYRDYSDNQEVLARVEVIRRRRSRKKTGTGEGRFRNLPATFDSLNRHYFAGRLRVALLAWSRRPTRRILGHYDRCHDAIVISRSLDRPEVPSLLFEFILFHEMLHAQMGERRVNGRRYSHHAEFKTREREFESYGEAQRLLRRFGSFKPQMGGPRTAAHTPAICDT